MLSKTAKDFFFRTLKKLPEETADGKFLIPMRDGCQPWEKSEVENYVHFMLTGVRK